jgi:hypothetical protein
MNQNDIEHARSCVTIDEMALQEEYIRLPSDFAYFSELNAEAKRMFALSKVDRDITRSRLRMVARETLEASGKRATESMVDAAVELDPVWLEVKTKEIELEANAVRIHGVLESLRTKRDMLISLGAHTRAEMKSF